MQRAVWIALPLLMAACAPNSSIPQSRTDRSIVSVQTTTGGAAMELRRDAAITSAALSADPAVVWAALPGAYAEIEIPVTGIDTGNRLLTAQGQRIRRIGGESVARYFSCPGAYGNAAATGDVYMTLRTQVLSGEGGSGATVRTEVEAIARSSTGANSQVNCATNGELEKLIMEALAAKLGAG
jgi:hypothetical protein